MSSPESICFGEKSDTAALLPGRDTSAPATPSMRCASRSELRETPNRSQSSASLGSSAPGANSPVAIIRHSPRRAVSTAVTDALPVMCP